jgi:hypothetical protein
MAKYLLLLTTALLLLGGCSEDTGTTNTEPGVNDPFVAENYWIYRSTNYNTDGSIESVETDSLAVIVSKTHGSQTIIEFSSAVLLTRTELGIWNDLGLLYKYPSKVGDTLFIQTAIPFKTDTTFGADMKRYTDEVNTTVTVPAGTFQSYKYISSTTKTNSDTVVFRTVDYFNPRIGLIKSEVFSATKLQLPLVKRSERELIRYHIK